MNPLQQLQAEWDRAADNGNAPEDRPTLGNIILGGITAAAAIYLLALFIWIFGV